MLGVPCDDDGKTPGQRRMVLNGILEINEIGVKGLGDDWLVHRQHRNQPFELLENLDSIRGRGLFAQKLEEVGKAQRRDIRLDLTPLRHGKETGRRLIKGLPAGQHIKNDIRVDKYGLFHRYFSVR